MDIEGVLARDLTGEIPSGVRPFIESGERALVVIRGIPGAIVATDRRVIVERTSTPTRPQIYSYQELTGAVGHLEFLGRRSVALEGPGLKTDLNVLEIGASRNATVVAIWRVVRYRESVAELNGLISAMNPPRTGRRARGEGQRGRREGARGRRR